MPKDLKERAVAEAKRAQLDYKRDVDAAREARRKSFDRAQKAGPSLRDIGEAVGRRRSRVGEILRGELSTVGAGRGHLQSLWGQLRWAKSASIAPASSSEPS